MVDLLSNQFVLLQDPLCSPAIICFLLSLILSFENLLDILNKITVLGLCTHSDKLDTNSYSSPIYANHIITSQRLVYKFSKTFCTGCHRNTIIKQMILLQFPNTYWHTQRAIQATLFCALPSLLTTTTLEYRHYMSAKSKNGQIAITA